MKTNLYINSQKLGELVEKINKHSSKEIAWIVKLMENPSSKISMPGRITLYNHDSLHIILNESTSPQGEAFVLGFTMGNDTDTKFYHVFIFKLCLKYIYPRSYRLSNKHLKYFDIGLQYGRHIEVKNINQIDFYKFRHNSINVIRNKLGINLNLVELLKLNLVRTMAGKPKKNYSSLKLFSCICAIIGGILLASNIKYSNYGFIPLAFSSSSMLVASIQEQNFLNTLYSASLFITVDLLGIYRWIL